MGFFRAQLIKSAFCLVTPLPPPKKKKKKKKKEAFLSIFNENIFFSKFSGLDGCNSGT